MLYISVTQQKGCFVRTLLMKIENITETQTYIHTAFQIRNNLEKSCHEMIVRRFIRTNIMHSFYLNTTISKNFFLFYWPVIHLMSWWKQWKKTPIPTYETNRKANIYFSLIISLSLYMMSLNVSVCSLSLYWLLLIVSSSSLICWTFLRNVTNSRRLKII